MDVEEALAENITVALSWVVLLVLMLIIRVRKTNRNATKRRVVSRGSPGWALPGGRGPVLTCFVLLKIEVTTLQWLL